MPRRKSPPVATDLEVVAEREYQESGEVTGMLALADMLRERGERAKFEKLIRSEARKKDPMVHFFYTYAGWSYQPATETEFEGRLKLSRRLARADRKLEADWSDLRCRWEQDHEYNPRDYDVDMPDVGWVCILEELDYSPLENYSEPVWVYLDSTGGVTFGPEADYPTDDPYHQVVQAELVAQNRL